MNDPAVGAQSCVIEPRLEGAEPGLRFVLPSAEPERFTMGDLLRFAGTA